MTTPLHHHSFFPSDPDFATRVEASVDNLRDFVSGNAGLVWIQMIGGVTSWVLTIVGRLVLLEMVSASRLRTEVLAVMRASQAVDYPSQ